jgi:hypothetical protein
MKKIIPLLGCLLLSLACNLGVPAPGSGPTASATPLSAPGLDAAAQAAIAAETPSSTLEPPPPYFTEEFDASSPYWKIIQIGGAQPATSTFNGSLRIDYPAPDSWIIGIHIIHSYSNVYLRAKTSVDPGGSVGLICRYNETNGWFEFNAASDGTYSLLLGKWLTGGIAAYVPIVNDNSDLIKSPALELGLFCEDNFLRLYINNTLIRNVDVTNYGLTGGNIGVSAASFSQAPMTAIFEWVKVDQK